MDIDDRNGIMVLGKMSLKEMLEAKSVMDSKNAIKDTRLVARVSQDVQELINSAAGISGTTISQFIVEAATTKALDIISQTQTIKLSMSGAAKVFDVIDNPPAPNKKLMAAAKRYQSKGFEFNANSGSIKGA